MSVPPGPPGGAWVDLLGLCGDEDAIASATLGDAVVRRLAQRVVHLAVVEPDDREAQRLRALLSDVSAEVEVGQRASVAPPGRVFDVAVAPAGAADLETFAAAVAEHGRLAMVADNPFSPLRVLDRLGGRRGGPAAGGLRHVRRRLARAGLGTVTVHGLLRSSADPRSAFRVDLPHVAETVLREAQNGSGRARAAAIAGLRLASRHGMGAHLVSAWLFVASRQAAPVGPTTPTGRIAVAANEQGALLLGSGPDAVEKHYADPATLDATVSALAELEEAGVAVGPRVLDRPDRGRLRTTYVPGHVLDAHRLPPDELCGWLAQAAACLGDIQRATLDAQGQVLVHGDFWLGCIVVQGARINGVIDWSDAHRGDPRTDLRRLVDVVVTRADLTASDRRRMLAAVADAHEAAGGPPAARDALPRL